MRSMIASARVLSPLQICWYHSLSRNWEQKMVDDFFLEGVKFSVSMGKIFFDKNQICIIVLSKFLVFCCRIIYLIIVLPIRLRLYLNFKIFCSTNNGIGNPFFVGSAHTRPRE